MKRSLRNKILVHVVTVSIIAVLIAAFVSTVGVRMYVVSNYQLEMQRMGKDMSSWAEQMLVSGFEFGGGKQRNNSNITLVNSEGVVVYPGYNFGYSLAPQDQALFDKVSSARKTVTDVQKIDGEMNGEVMIVGMPIYHGEEFVGVMFLSRPIVEIYGFSNFISQIVIVAAAFSIIIAIITGLILSKRITKPLLDLNSATIKMAQGEYGIQASVSTKDEIGQLAENFNLLSSELDKTISELNLRKGQLENMVRDLNEGLVSLDKKGNLILANPAAYSLLGSDLVGTLTPLMATAGQIYRWTREDEKIIEAICYEQKDYYLCLARDITESEKLEQMRRHYVANVSHEFRAPLTAIRGFVEPLMDGMIEDPAELASTYKIILDETMRLDRMINAMLDLSRLQSGELVLEPLRIEGILHSVVDRYKDRAEQQEVRLVCSIQGELSAVMGLEDRIDQVLVILVTNALKHTAGGGTVELFAYDTGEKIQVGVADTGCGIDACDIPYIFERFYKADKARSSGGFGLGLSIAKEIVEGMGNKIHVESEVGVGSKFFFTLSKANDILLK